jgi:hypothetical protein
MDSKLKVFAGEGFSEKGEMVAASIAPLRSGLELLKAHNSSNLQPEARFRDFNSERGPSKPLKASLRDGVDSKFIYSRLHDDYIHRQPNKPNYTFSLEDKHNLCLPSRK